MTAGKSSDGALSDPGCVLTFLVIHVLLYAAPTDAAKRSNKDELERLPILGNKKSHIYHRPDCPNYQQISANHRVRFGSEKDAKAAGYRLAKNCP